MGMRIVVTAGPTREPIDPVRFISNRSSGKMGYALAVEAAARGHAVRLVSGPVCLARPPGIRVVSVSTAAEMLRAVQRGIKACDILIMAAAVADWRLRRVHRHKLKKNDAPPTLCLERTPDILSKVAPLKGERLYVGFAAETRNLRAESLRKLAVKRLDLVVANDLAKIRDEEHPALIIGPSGHVLARPQTKTQIARELCHILAEALASA